jgi:hypothetical protein
MSAMRTANVVAAARVPRMVGDGVGFARTVFTTDNGPLTAKLPRLVYVRIREAQPAHQRTRAFAMRPTWAPHGPFARLDACAELTGPAMRYGNPRVRFAETVAPESNQQRKRHGVAPTRMFKRHNQAHASP